MKKIFFTILTVIFIMSTCYAQDIITKKTGAEIKTKILEVGQSEIKYKKTDNLDGPTYTILKSDVIMIIYENGTNDVFFEEKKNENTTSENESNRDLFPKGQSDALRHYRGYKYAGTGTLLVSLISPVIGLIPAITCSTTLPKEKNLNYTDPDLMKKRDYYYGYTDRAKKIKQRKIWSNWGIAFAVNIVAFVIITNQ